MAEETEQRCEIADEEESNEHALTGYDKGVPRRARGRKSVHPSTNAARERSRVQNLKQAFLELQKALPNVPSGTKLSKLDILLLATNYISHLMSKLSNGHLKEHLSRLKDTGALHPIKKWPMRSRLYVSDPMWLYRSGRQSMMINQRPGSPSSSSVSCEESPPTIEPVDLHSPSDSPLEGLDRLNFYDNCRDRNYNSGIDVNISYAYHGAEGSYLTSFEEQQSYPMSSCRFQKVLPALEIEHQNS